MMRLQKDILVAIAVILMGSAPTWAQSGGGFDLTWSSIAGGGALNSAGGIYSLSGTIGLPGTAPMTGGSFSLTGGFWPVANVCNCLADMNGDGRKDGRDVQLFVNCVLAGGNCSCADTDQTNGVTLADVAPFVNDLLTDPTCP